ncbi:hypothetical protein IAR50_003178 [Cryptococcus sp. DSM 104548]
MGADSRPNKAVGSIHTRHPVLDHLVNGIFEGLGTGSDGDDVGAQHLDSEHVEFLTTDVFGAHVDVAFEATFGADGGGADAMLSTG